MTPFRLSRARDRFPALVRLLQQRGLSRALVDATVVPNRMTVTRWAQGSQSPSEEQLTRLVSWAQDNASLDARRIFEKSEEMWAALLSRGGDLKTMRKSRGLKQSEVATALGVSRYTYLLCEREGGVLAERARKYLQGLPCGGEGSP